MKNLKYILIVLLFAIISCKSNKESETASEHETLPPNVIEFSAEQYKSAGITLDSIHNKQISNTILVNGFITVPPQSFATVCASYGGYIKNSSLMQGSYVYKGQTLAMIENAEFVDLQQNYLETKSKLYYAETEYNRQKELNSKNANSAKTFQQSELEYKTLKVQLNSLIQKLSILSINYTKLNEDNINSVLPLISPISGYVKTVNINIGKYINSTDILFEIVNTDMLTLELNVFEKDVLNIKEGQKLVFTIPNRPEKEYEAIIIQAGKTLDSDKTSKIYASIPNTSKNLIAGMYINAKIDINNSKGISLPSEAIVQFDEKYYIFAFQENTTENGKLITLFEAIEIKSGKEDNGFTEIIFLKNGNQNINKKYVIKGAYTILSKFKNSGEMEC
jgi:cobalt-zinc-cadmium efflux system membrane fusion protein